MGVDFSLGANMLTMGPFAELFEKNPDAYYSHLVRNLIAFQFGFLGAYVYFIGSVVRAYFTLDLTSHHLRRWRHPHDRRKHTGAGALLRLRLRFP